MKLNKIWHCERTWRQKGNSRQPFQPFFFAYLAYFAVSSGALGSSLPAAAGGGFGFGKLRRDEQRCLVQKLRTGIHRRLLGAGIRHLPSGLSALNCFSPTTLTCPADILSRSRERGIPFEAERMSASSRGGRLPGRNEPKPVGLASL